MKCYIERKNRIILDTILELIKQKEENRDIDTITVCENDLTNVLNELAIKDFSFSFVKGLRKTLSFESYKIVEKTDKYLKVKKIIETDFINVPLKYC
jgi:phage FluMu gp28-like protein